MTPPGIPLHLHASNLNDKAEQWRAAFLCAVTHLGYVESGYGHEASVFLQVFTQKDVTIKDAEVFMWRRPVLREDTNETLKEEMESGKKKAGPRGEAGFAYDVVRFGACVRRGEAEGGGGEGDGGRQRGGDVEADPFNLGRATGMHLPQTLRAQLGKQQKKEKGKPLPGATYPRLARALKRVDSTLTPHSLRRGGHPPPGARGGRSGADPEGVPPRDAERVVPLRAFGGVCSGRGDGKGVDAAVTLQKLVVPGLRIPSRWLRCSEVEQCSCVSSVIGCWSTLGREHPVFCLRGSVTERFFVRCSGIGLICFRSSTQFSCVSSVFGFGLPWVASTLYTVSEAVR